MGWFGDSSFSANGHATGYSSPGPVPGPGRGILARLRQIGSGWLGPKQSARTSIAEKLKAEQAASGPRSIFDLPWFLPYYDNYTQETPEMRQAYRQMWADSNVKAACIGKIFSVAALDLKFKPANKTDSKAKRDADFCDYVFNDRLKGAMPELAWSILSGAMTDGYSIAEKVWGQENHGKWKGNWIIRAIKPKDTLNDLAPQTDEFRNITGILGLRYNAGREFSPANFVIFRNMALYDQPVGMSDFRSVYKDWWLLDTAKKLRAIGVEKRSYPMLLAHWKNQSDQSGLEAALAKAKWQNWMTAHESAKLEAVDIAGQGDRIFADTIKDLKHDIFLGIRGAVLQSLEGTISDARGNSQVHKETTELIDWFIAASLVRAFNDHEGGLIRDVLDLNYFCEEYPKASLSAVDLNELEVKARIDQTLHTFLPLSMEEIYEDYQRTPPKSQEDAIQPVQQGQGPGGMGLGGLGGAGGSSGGNGIPGLDIGGGALNAAEEKLSKFLNIDGMTAPAKLLQSAERGVSASPFRFAEEWEEYIST